MYMFNNKWITTGQRLVKFRPKLPLQSKVHPFKGSTVSNYKIHKILSDILWRRMLPCCPPKKLLQLAIWFLVRLFGVYRFTREFYKHMQMSPLAVKGCIFDLCSALMVIENWGFFSVPHLLWHRPTLYYGYLRGPVTFTPVAKRLAVELSLPVLTTEVCRDISRMRGERSTSTPPRRYSLRWVIYKVIYFASQLTNLNDMINFFIKTEIVSSYERRSRYDSLIFHFVREKFAQIYERTFYYNRFQ